MRRIVLAMGVTAAGLSFWMGGCTPPVNSVERAQPIARPTVIADRRVLADSGLASATQVVGVNQAMSGDLLKIQVSLFNSTGSRANFNYKFEWFDGNGMIVDSPMSIWTPQSIEAAETLELTSVAPNPRAKDFRLKLQESNQQ